MWKMFTKLLFLIFTFVLFAGDLYSAEFKIMADDTLDAAHFGQAVSINGDYILVGAPWDLGKGAAYIYYKDEGGSNNWGQQIKLLGDESDLWSGANYGQAVDIEGDFALVGANIDTLGDSTDAGSAYLYNRNQGGANSWGRVKKITADDSLSYNYFGRSVSISDTIIAIGAPQEVADGLDSTGSVYIFYKNQGGTDNWGQFIKIKPADGNGSDFFGYSVALSGSDLVVGAWGVDDVGTNRGRIYIYSKDEGGTDNWGLQAQHLPTLDGVNQFGIAVDIDGDYIISGAPAADTAGYAQTGDCHIYYRNQGGNDNWGLQQKIIAEDPSQYKRFGVSVSIDGNYIIVGAWSDLPLQDDAMYAYLRSGSTWTQTSRTVASDIQPDDEFGFSVDISGDYSVVGSGFVSDGSFSQAGAAYIYESIADLSLPVTLSSFNAIAAKNNVRIDWRTESEIENLGFIIQRSNTEDGVYEEIVSYKTNQNLIGQVNSAAAKDYSYTDYEVVGGNNYWYKLVDVNINGKMTSHGPIHALVTSGNENLASSFNLLPVYPNPFNLSAKFSVSVETPDNSSNSVNIDIYNNLGQKIKSVFSGNLENGLHSFSWNGTSDIGREVASGMYLLVLKSRNQYITQKLLMLK